MSGIIIHNRQRTARVDKAWKSTIEKALMTTLAMYQLEKAEVWVGLVSNRRIKEINLQTRNIEQETDVLSFPAIEWQGAIAGDVRSLSGYLHKNPETNQLILGDIIIALPFALEQAKELGHSIERELSFLSIHGLLHLLGFDHETEQEEQQMFAIQDQILHQIGIGR